VALDDLAAIRLVLTDFDGVLTDNRVLVDQDGREAVFCNRADGLGCDLLRAAGIEVLIVSTETNPVVAARARKLRVGVLQAVDDKAAAVAGLLAERGLRPEEALFIGNDVNDLGALTTVGVAVCPADAHADVRAVAAHVTGAVGGSGVLREVTDLLLAARRAATPDGTGT
jgi:YrbI family 3-deoxy-D-manno-octulosonate 8-phosphate phosphatase